MAGNANSGSKRDKLIRDALMLAVKRIHSDDPLGRNMLALAAEQVVAAAVGGDLAAFKEIADRLDGKPSQQLEHTGAEGGPIEQVIRDARQAVIGKISRLAERVATKTDI